MNRRNFLRTVALTGAAFTLKESDAMSILSQSFDSANAANAYDLVAVMGGEPDAMFCKQLQKWVKMSKFISKGDKVVVETKYCWDQPIEMVQTQTLNLLLK